MIFVLYFVVGSHFGFPRLVFCSAFGAILLDGFVFCRPLFSTKSPVSTFSRNEQGDPNPDYAELADSAEFRFQSIDSKLSIALQNMVDAAGETAFEVKVRIRQRSQMLGKEGNFLMGREILAMIRGHFRTTSKDEVLFNASHIYKLQYRGDKEMDKFLNA